MVMMIMMRRRIAIGEMHYTTMPLKQKVLSLAVIGRLLPTREVATMHGSSTSTAAASTTAASPIEIMCVVLEAGQ